MLQEIRITNFAIIENLAIEFHAGLNVLTGETGAGKSIIIDALNLILGGRADTDTIRSGASTATVEACLTLSDPKTLAMIADLGIEVENGQVIIKRIISNSDKNRAYLNNSNLTVAALSKIGDRPRPTRSSIPAPPGNAYRSPRSLRETADRPRNVRRALRRLSEKNINASANADESGRPPATTGPAQFSDWRNRYRQFIGRRRR
jgi:energy-coupling factor transporter ATP-binding protein EcfA2